jgi:hypothetical protein
MCGVGTMHHCPPGGADDEPGVPTECLDDPDGRGRKSMSVRKSFQPLELLGWPIAPSHGTVEGRYGGLDPLLYETLCLWRGGGVEDVL